jgi:hypothetical protein
MASHKAQIMEMAADPTTAFYKMGDGRRFSFEFY